MRLTRPPGRFVSTPAFVERRCPHCDDGCDACEGGGTVGSLTNVETFVPDEVPARAHEMRRLRMDCGLGLREVATRLGVTVVEVCDMERGRLVPDDWSAVFAALECEP